MSTHVKRIFTLTVILVSLILGTSHAATFTSTTTGPWNDGATWGNASPGTEGVDWPASIDDAVIVASTVVTLQGNRQITNLTINLSGELSISTFDIFVSGNYTIDGVNSGSGKVRLTGSGTTILGGGSITNTDALLINGGDKEIDASANFTKSGGNFRIKSGVTVTNFGTVTVTDNLRGDDASAIWINETNSTLSGTRNIMDVGTFQASATGNTVVYSRTGSGAQTITSPDGGIYFNLTITGNNTNSVKSLGGDITVNNDLTISGSTFDVSASVFSVNISGNWTKTGGAFESRTGTVSFQGTGVQQIAGTQSWYNIKMNNTAGVTITSGANDLTSSLSISNGTFTTGGFLRLISDASGTARIAEITGTGAVSGNVIVQRHIDLGATEWRFLSSPVSGINFESWDDDFITSGFTGSDFPLFPFVSIYSYEEAATGSATNGYTALSTSAQSINVGEGYWVWCGDSLGGTAPFTIDVAGNVNSGSVSLPVSFTASGGASEDGWTMVGNPYPCPIDWDDGVWTKNNMNDATYIWDPDNQQYASYINGSGANGGSNRIALGQGFWVQANAASPVLTAAEGVKINAEATFFKQFVDEKEELRIAVSGNGFGDETVIRTHPDATPDFDGQYDATKLFSTTYGVPSIHTVGGSNVFSINSVPAINQTTTVPLVVQVDVSGNYQLDATKTGFQESACLILEDLLLDSLIDLSEQSTYTAYIEDSTTYPRFLVHITPGVLVDQTGVSCFGMSDGEVLVTGMAGGVWGYELFDSAGALLQQDSNLTVPTTLNNLAEGEHQLIITYSQGHCPQVDQAISIDSPEEIVVLFETTEDSVTLGTTFEFKNLTTGADTYWWTFGDGEVSSLESPFHTYSEVGSYEVKLRASKQECFEELIQGFQVVADPTGIDGELTDNSPFLIYQTNAGKLVIEYTGNESELVTLRWLDIAGRQVGQEKLTVNPGTSTIDISDFATGTYLLQLNWDAQQLTRKIIR